MVIYALHELPQSSKQILESVFPFLKGSTPACHHGLNQAILTIVARFLCKYFSDSSDCFWPSNARDIAPEQPGACANVIKVLNFHQINVLFEESFIVSSVQVLLQDEYQVNRVSGPFPEGDRPMR